MALNKKSLGPAILSLEKGKIEDVKAMHLAEFAKVQNPVSGEEMIAFTTKETPDVYYWASTSLYKFLDENIDNAEPDEDRLTFSFPEDPVEITHMGKVPVKSDSTKTCNKWKIVC